MGHEIIKIYENVNHNGQEKFLYLEMIPFLLFPPF